MCLVWSAKRPARLLICIHVRNNPLKLIDPSGHGECGSPWEQTCNEPQYDLTGWLPGAMRRGAQAEQLDLMRYAYIAALTDDSDTTIIWAAVWLDEASTTFLDLNTKFGEWDVKREMEVLGEGITLCSSDACRWVDYSVPGNILYGYVAASVGMPEDFSRIAGGILEILEGNFNPAFADNAFENPYDSIAVGFGYDLFEEYGPDITNSEFSAALTTDILVLFQPPPDTFSPPGPAQSQENSYSVQRFDCLASRDCIDPEAK